MAHKTSPVSHGRTASNFYSIDSDKLAAIKAALPDIAEEEVAGFVLGDWPQGTEHQEWLDSAAVSDIADWVNEAYELAVASHNEDEYAE